MGITSFLPRACQLRSRLLNQQTSSESHNHFEEVNSSGWTPLMEAVHFSELDGCSRLPVVQLLVEAGADPDIKRQNGRTALDSARRKGYTDVVAYLEPLTGVSR